METKGKGSFEVLYRCVSFIINFGKISKRQYPQEYINITIKTLEKNGELYSLLSKSNVASKHLEKLKDTIIEQILRLVKANEKYADREDNDFLIQFLVGGMMEICIQWLNGKIEISLDEVTKKISKMIVMTGREFMYTK